MKKMLLILILFSISITSFSLSKNEMNKIIVKMINNFQQMDKVLSSIKVNSDVNEKYPIMKKIVSRLAEMQRKYAYAQREIRIYFRKQGKNSKMAVELKRVSMRIVGHIQRIHNIKPDGAKIISLMHSLRRRSRRPGKYKRR